MANIIFRVKDAQKEAYEGAATGEGMSLSDWLKGMADERSGYLREKGVPVRGDLGVLPERVREKLASVKKARAVPVGKGIDVSGRIYTGATAHFNGAMQYEYETEKGMRWTTVAPASGGVVRDGGGK